MGTAFVIMPFAQHHAWAFGDIFEPALRNEYAVLRADDPMHQHQILRDIVGGIRDADVVVADLSGLNPNVMYELGVAHALGVPVILLCEQSTKEELKTKLPFDLQPYRVEFFENTDTSKQRSKERLSRMGQLRARGELRFGSPVSDTIGSVLQTLNARAFKVLSTSIDRTIEPELDLAAAAESFLQAIERSNELSAIWSSRVRAANGEAVGEAIAHYAHRSNQPKFTRRDARENARPVVEAVKVYVEQLEAAASPMVEAIIILEESTDDFLSVPWIQTSEDRSWAQYIIDIALDAAKSVNEIARTVEEAGSNWTDALSFRPETKSTAPALQRAVNTHAQLIDLYVAYLLRVADVVEERLEQA